MDGEMVLERYCEENNIDVKKWSAEEREQFGIEIDNEIEGFLDQCWGEKKFDGFIAGLLN